jgi:hypothetical protein
MVCRACGSENLQKLSGELTASFTSVENSKFPPLYFSREFWACLDCGFVELRIPAAQLQSLRKKKALGS